MRTNECPRCGALWNGEASEQYIWHVEDCKEWCPMLDEEIDEDLTENSYGSKLSIRFDENGFEIRH